MADLAMLAAVAPGAVDNKAAPVLEREGQPETGVRALETEHGGSGPENHVDPSALGLNGTGWVSLAMAIFLLVVIVKGGWRAVAGLLDKRIGEIRHQLDEAKALRAEAEALRDEYARKIADAEKDAGEMTRHAEAEAEAIVAQAKADAAELVGRRAKMAEDKIAAAERQALADVRAKTAEAATGAAAALIAARHDAAADRALVDKAIRGIGRPH